MSEEAVIRVRLVVDQAKAESKQLEASLKQTSEAAGGIGKALFGSISSLGLGFGAIGGATVGPAVGAAVGGIAGSAAQALGLSGYVGRVGAAMNARDSVIQGLGPAGKYGSDGDIMSMYAALKQYEDALAESANRIRSLTNPDVAGRAIGPLTPLMQRVVNWLPDSLFR